MRYILNSTSCFRGILFEKRMFVIHMTWHTTFEFLYNALQIALLAYIVSNFWNSKLLHGSHDDS